MKKVKLIRRGKVVGLVNSNYQKELMDWEAVELSALTFSKNN
jgi:hypothetical protein